MHFKVFSSVKVQNGDHSIGLLKFQTFFLSAWNSLRYIYIFFFFFFCGGGGGG